MTPHPNTTSTASAGRTETWVPVLLLPVFSFLVVLPSLLRGPSCGHDFGFHMQSWMDAAAQMRHGNLLPRWAYSPAFNAGEPRFVFYPPLSWMAGALLLQALPAALAPALYTWLALTLAAIGMFTLARLFARPWPALLATTLYLVNPYLLFTAWERTAYAELLAAAWLPWLCREFLRERPRVLNIALPVALLWLTNAPAAVMGVYALGLMILVRCGVAVRKHKTMSAAWPFLRAGGGGLLLGMGLAGFYLLPAAWERRYVQIAMAIIPNMRIEDNFLFGHTGYGPHDVVLHTASLVAVALLGITAVTLSFAFWRGKPDTGSAFSREQQLVLGVLGCAVALLVWHPALPIWLLLPEMRFLQFPWRLMAVLGCVFGAAAGIGLGRMRLPATAAIAGALVLACAGALVAWHTFREKCEAGELPAERLVLFEAHHGVGPTDEYTPGDSDNDQLRWDNPGWWLATNVDAPGPGTVPNPAATIVNYDEPPPLGETVSEQAPRHLQLTLPRPGILVLNLRDYPAWTVRVNGTVVAHLQRDDGLLALRLPAGAEDVEIRWRTLTDVWIGDALSACSIAVVLLLAATRKRSDRQRAAVA